MATKLLNRVSTIDELMLDRLLKHNFKTCTDVLSRTEFELMHILDISKVSAHELLLAISKAVIPKPSTIVDMLKLSHNCLPTTLGELDQILKGGIPSGSITEIVGAAGAGKTQLCHLLSVIATLPQSLGGLEGSVIYIDTESSFSSERLVQIAKSRFEEYFTTEERIFELASKVMVHNQLTTSQELVQRLESLEEEIITQNVKLVLLDSVASIVRKEYDKATMFQRQELLIRQAQLLKYLSESFQIPIVVTNQLSSQYSGRYDFLENEKKEERRNASQTSVTAALGTIWAHAVNTRLVLEYFSEDDRRLTIAKCPFAPVISFRYVITEASLELIESNV